MDSGPSIAILSTSPWAWLLVLLISFRYNASRFVKFSLNAGFIMKTTFATNETVERKWYLIDATDQILGRLASQIAQCLRGKNKPYFTPHVDTGDYVIVINAAQIKVTGKKTEDKIYYRHSGYPGGIKQRTFTELKAKKPTEIIEKAVKGMLPKNILGRAMLRKLKVYSGPTHPHTAQIPEKINPVKVK